MYCYLMFFVIVWFCLFWKEKNFEFLINKKIIIIFYGIKVCVSYLLLLLVEDLCIFVFDVFFCGRDLYLLLFNIVWENLIFVI